MREMRNRREVRRDLRTASHKSSRKRPGCLRRTVPAGATGNERLVVGEFHACEGFRDAVCYVVHAPLPSVRFRVIDEFIFESDFALFILENERQFIFLWTGNAD